MKKLEFLKKLKDALSPEMDARSVKEQISYYSHYIDEEVAKGRSEGEVVDALGDPWLIARTLLDSPGEAYQMPENMTLEDDDSETFESHVHSFAIDTWWKRGLFWIVVVFVLVIIGLVIWGAAVISVKYILPVMLLAWLIRRIVTALFGR